MRRYFYCLISFLIYLNANGAENLLKDEIVFFNVGQGHAALVYKTGQVPLLVDAGSDGYPDTAGEMYEWTRSEESSLVSRISDKILCYWRNFNRGNLQGSLCNLNIIITHPDKDHKDFVPKILTKLREAAHSNAFHFSPTALLGGTEALYAGYSLEGCGGGYSTACLGLYTAGNFGFLESSGCITHLFCPSGIKSDDNRWSIITRIQINGISAILCGDAVWMVKKQMMEAMGKLKRPWDELASDILLVPHHGSENTFYPDWDNAVNPQALIIGAAPNKGQHGNRHPRGETIHQLLNVIGGRVLGNRVMPHCILYNCNQSMHDLIQGTHFTPRQRLFDIIPNNAVPTGEVANKWQVAWIDVPLYTLWTTGTLIFCENVDRPQFIEAPNGVMTYVAVPNFRYLLPPEQRVQNSTLVSLVDVFLAGGEGEVEQLTRMVITLSTEGTIDLAREGIILTDGLSLYQNRSRMIRALLNMQPTESTAVLDLTRPLMRQNKKSFSDKYRILEAVTRMQPDIREPFVRFIMNNFLPPTEDDAFHVANTLEVYSQTSLEEAQEIVHFMQPHFPSFLNMTQRERMSVLKMMKALLNLERGRRNTVYQWAQPFIMQRELSMAGDSPHVAFHDVENNASLITIFSQTLPNEVEGFTQLLQEAWGHLMTEHGPRYLYGENKHFFIRGLLSIASPERMNFLRTILPALSQVSQKRFESWVAAAITEELAKIYSEPHFALRVEFLLRQESERQNKEESVFHPEYVERWIKTSVVYARKRAQQAL